MPAFQTSGVPIVVVRKSSPPKIRFGDSIHFSQDAIGIHPPIAHGKIHPPWRHKKSTLLWRAIPPSISMQKHHSNKHLQIHPKPHQGSPIVTPQSNKNKLDFFVQVTTIHWTVNPKTNKTPSKNSFKASYLFILYIIFTTSSLPDSKFTQASLQVHKFHRPENHSVALAARPWHQGPMGPLRTKRPDGMTMFTGENRPIL